MRIIKRLPAVLLTLFILFSANLLAKGELSRQKSHADPGVINKERIEYWLKKRGELGSDATSQQIKEQIDAFTAKTRAYVVPDFLAKASSEARKRADNSSKKKTKSNIQKSAEAIVPKTVKVLAVLIDFPDLPFDANGLSPADTKMYYPSYPMSHYQELMFSTNGFDGPNGEKLLSAYQYYLSESGSAFYFTGNTYGWVTADNNAATYGANDPDNNDDDLNVPALVKEAVEKAVNENSIDLSEYDLEDPYDVDDDGNLQEADGFIDHVMIFHSSIGEEAGGGILGAEAIWSHRFFVNQTGNASTMGYEIPDTGKRVFGYTIQPIDAAAGVVVHEFGHDLGLPDEYDTGEENKGSPVGNWSIMASGSWAGDIPGAQPTGFSSYARSYLQENHAANWVNESVIELDSLETPLTIELIEAVNHENTTANQIKITLPLPEEAFKQPYTDNYQYYSGEGHDLNNRMSFSLNLPDSDNLLLSMKAHWSIEDDWDYARVLINDIAIEGNHTRATNPYTGQYQGYDGVVHYISGKSENVAGAEGDNFWLDLSYDVSSYRGQTVTVKFEYITDSNTGDYGFVVDDIRLLDNASQIYFDGAETENNIVFDGFKRIDHQRDGAEQNYWIQLRSHNDVDTGLATEGYEAGLLVWFSDSKYADNQSSAHPGRGLIGVVDADQNLIGTHDSSVQIRDAAFSLFPQSSYQAPFPYDWDIDLSPTAVFNDNHDYSSPSQPESGIILPRNGLKLELTAQAADSSNATIQVSKLPTEVTASFSYAASGTTVTFSDNSFATEPLTYLWDFGDLTPTSSLANPVHSYAEEGIYEVTLNVTEESGDSDSLTQSVIVGTPVSPAFSVNATDNIVTFTDESSGGIGSVNYRWNFGDGNTSTEQSPSHTYTEAGNFEVTLTVTDLTGSYLSTVDVEIGISLFADFSFTRTERQVNFLNASEGGLGELSYNWNFDDGNTSSDISPSHTYTTDGTYSVELTVTDSYNNQLTVSKTVSVQTATISTGGGGGGSLLWLLIFMPLTPLLRKKI